ncbi:MAG: trypsin-like peptidase domain-containing protein [Gammaproteobacteria bacterium]
MKRVLAYGRIWLGMLLLIGHGCLWASPTFSKPQLDNIYNATYEVIVKKLVHDPLQYERPLPLSLIPYKVRHDKYWSIGTAFAIGHNKFVSAAHVFGLEHISQYTDYHLRDRKGRIYDIDKVIKYAGNRDFIVFTLKKHRSKSILKVDEQPQLNTRVYAVGNAHGDGVVIRDGLFTSTTPEETDGAWSWIRFSAAASPGNSGGPLLDEKGKVIGIVLRKSESENLNYALPISEVLKAPAHLAVHNMPVNYVLDNMDFQKMDRFKYKHKLPMSLHDLNVSLSQHLYDFSRGLLRQLLAENHDKIFPQGSQSHALLHKTYYSAFPDIIWQKNDGSWVPFLPNHIRHADLGHNGELSYGFIKTTTLFRLKKPDNVSYDKFINNGKLLMDYFLKGVKVTRRIGSEKIRITSFGKPLKQTEFTDHYGRKWIVRKWLLGYNDSGVVTMTLPTPDGSVTMLRNDSTGRISGHLLDLKVLSNFIYVSYYGTVKEWRGFLAHKSLIPAPLKDVTLSYKPNKELAFSSDAMKFDYSKSLMAITDNSDLSLHMSYYKKHNKVVWDVARVMVGENKDNNTYFLVSRTAHPDKDMNDEDKAKWTRLVDRQFPYNKVSYFKDKNTFISTVYNKGLKASSIKQRPYLFSVLYGAEGKVDQKTVETKINTFVHKLNISSN